MGQHALAAFVLAMPVADGEKAADDQQAGAVQAQLGVEQRQHEAEHRQQGQRAGGAVAESLAGGAPVAVQFEPDHEAEQRGGDEGDQQRR